MMSVRVDIFESQSTMQCARTSGNNLRTPQNADKPYTDSDCFGFVVVVVFSSIFVLAEMIVINHGFQVLFHGNPRKRGRILPLIYLYIYVSIYLSIHPSIWPELHKTGGLVQLNSTIWCFKSSDTVASIYRTKS